MLDRKTKWLLRLYPEEFRDRYGPQIEADLHHPDTNLQFALFDIVRGAILLRLSTPAFYVWAAAFLLSGVFIGVSIPLATHHLVRLLSPRVESEMAMWLLMSISMLLPVFGTLIAAIHWLQTSQRLRSKCSKSKTSRSATAA